MGAALGKVIPIEMTLVPQRAHSVVNGEQILPALEMSRTFKPRRKYRIMITLEKMHNVPQQGKTFCRPSIQAHGKQNNSYIDPTVLA
jgi:hypothetical protein